MIFRRSYYSYEYDPVNMKKKISLMRNYTDHLTIFCICYLFVYARSSEYAVKKPDALKVERIVHVILSVAQLTFRSNKNFLTVVR